MEFQFSHTSLSCTVFSLQHNCTFFLLGKRADVSAGSSVWNFLTALCSCCSSVMMVKPHTQREGEAWGSPVIFFPHSHLPLWHFPNFPSISPALSLTHLDFACLAMLSVLGRVWVKFSREKPSHFHPDLVHFTLKLFHFPLWDFTFSL